MQNNRFKKLVAMMVLSIFLVAIYSAGGAMAGTSVQSDSSSMPTGDTTTAGNDRDIEDEEEDADEDAEVEEIEDGNADENTKNKIEKKELKLIKKLAKKKNYDEALSQLKSYLEMNPDSEEAQELIEDILEDKEEKELKAIERLGKEGFGEEALAKIQEYLQLNPNSEEAMELLGELIKEQEEETLEAFEEMGEAGLYEEAIEQVKAYLEANPDSRQAAKTLAELAKEWEEERLEAIEELAEADREQAMIQIEAFLTANPKSKKALKVLAELQEDMVEEELEAVEMLVETGRLQEALTASEELVDKYVPTEKMYKKMAKIQKKLGKIQEAIKNLETGAALNPLDKEVYRELADLYEQSGEEGIKVFVNGKKPVFDQLPVIKEGRTLVPVRAITEALGATVQYDPETGEIAIDRMNIRITLRLQSREALVNDQTIMLDVPANTINGRTVVPVRFISEALNSLVEYDSETEMIIITEDSTGQATEQEISEQTATETIVH